MKESLPSTFRSDHLQKSRLFLAGLVKSSNFHSRFHRRGDRAEGKNIIYLPHTKSEVERLPYPIMPLSCAKRSLIGARAKKIEQTRRHKTKGRSLKGATRDRCKTLSPALHLERKSHFPARTNSYVLSVE